MKHPLGYKWMDNDGNLHDEPVWCSGCRKIDVSQIEDSNYCESCINELEAKYG